MAEFEGRRGFFSQTVAQRDGTSSLGRRNYGSCLFCASSDTVWQHDLNPSLSTFRNIFGEGTIWANSHKVCDRCEQLYNAGDYGALARFQTANPPAYDDELADHLIGLVAFRRADHGPRELAQPDFPPGFEPWQEYTGAEFVFSVWPAHRRAVVDCVELVASPWLWLDLTAVFTVIWSWVERDRDHKLTQASIASRAAEALAWPEAKALTWLAKQ